MFISVHFNEGCTCLSANPRISVRVEYFFAIDPFTVLIFRLKEVSESKEKSGFLR